MGLKLASADNGYDPTEQALFTRIASYDAAGNSDAAKAAAQQLRNYQAQQVAQASSTAMTSAQTQPAAQAVQQGQQAASGPPEPDAYTPQAQQVLQGPAGAAESFLSGAVNQIPFGQAAEDAVGGVENAGVNALSQMTGGNVNIPFHYDPQAVRQVQQASQAAQPAAALAGGATGLATGLVGGLALGGAGDAAEGANALSSLGRMAGTGAALGGAQAGVSTADNELVSGKGLDPGAIAENTALGAGVGAAVAPIAQAATGLGAKIITGAGTKAWSYMARNLGMSVPDLQAALQSQADRGLQPNIQQVLTDQAAGTVNSVASKNPILAQGLRTSAAAADQQLPDQVATSVMQTPMPARPTNVAGVADNSQTPMKLLNANRDATNAAIGAIRDEPLTISADTVERPEFMQSIPSGPKWGDIRDTIADAQTEDADGNTVQGDVDFTVGQADRLRKLFNTAGNSPTGQGSPVADLAEDFRSEARDAHPGYDQALTDFANADNYRQGFNHAVTGSTEDASTNPGLIQALNTDEGAAGHTAGTLTYIRNQALSNPASAARTAESLSSNTAPAQFLRSQPGSQATQDTLDSIASSNRSTALSTPAGVRPAAEQNAGTSLAIGAIEGGTGHVGGALWNTLKAVSTYMGGQHFPQAVQNDFVNSLTSRDPDVINAALSRLQRSGASAAQIRRLSAVAGGLAGRSAGSIFGD